MLRLRDAPVDVTLIDRRNFHLFQPLVYQVATGALCMTAGADSLLTVRWRDRSFVLRAPEQVGELAGPSTQFCHQRFAANSWSKNATTRRSYSRGLTDSPCVWPASGTRHSVFGSPARS